MRFFTPRRYGQWQIYKKTVETNERAESDVLFIFLW